MKVKELKDLLNNLDDDTEIEIMAVDVLESVSNSMSSVGINMVIQVVNNSWTAKGKALIYPDTKLKVCLPPMEMFRDKGIRD